MTVSKTLPPVSGPPGSGEPEEAAIKPLPNQIYDPIGTQISNTPKGFVSEQGFILWPNGTDDRPRTRVMLLGNSTGIWPTHDWAIRVAEKLAEQDRPVTLMNGAVRAHTSSQELMRVIRDVPALRPDLVVSMSGICDAAWIVSHANYPFALQYGNSVSQAVLRTRVARHVHRGAFDARASAKVWLDNQRFAWLICRDLGIPYIAFLQPLLGVGRYVPTREEADLLASKAGKVLRGGMQYLDGMREFYGQVKEQVARHATMYRHVVDLTDAFEALSGAWTDHRHPNKMGEAALGEAAFAAIAAALPAER